MIVSHERQEADDRTSGAPGVTMTVCDVEEGAWHGGSELIFALEQGLTVGCRGFYDCGL